MLNVETDLDTTINEFYAKTIVTQKFLNSKENPLELKIIGNKTKENFIFLSFTCQIGDSIKVKSKIIKKEKAEEKYTDTISSGNSAIYVTYENNNIVLNLGNIPPKTEVIFISEFIQIFEPSKIIKYNIYKHLPIFQEDDNIYDNKKIKGKITIKTINEITKIKKNLSNDVEIIEEKYINEKKNEYILIYQYNEKAIEKSVNNIKIEIKKNENIAYIQQSSLNDDEINYLIQYYYKKSKLEKIDPALFIFLVDQSYSMCGSRIRIASKALEIFLQSLPVGSYYQIIGFGSNYKKYDEIPKEYNKENIEKSLKTVSDLSANLGGTEIYTPLNEIYNSNEIYDTIKLPKNIFILTDGGVFNKEEVLEIVKKNSLNYTIFSIGIGNSFDKELVKSLGIEGKGNYNFCQDLNVLNSIIVSEINIATTPFISNIEINSNLDNKYIFKNISSFPLYIRDDIIINLNYIVEKKDNNDKILLNIKYIDEEKNNKEKDYEIIPEKSGNEEDLSKIIIYNYLLNNKNLKKDEKIRLALKYQILTEDTSLFAKVELSNEIKEQMKLVIIDENNLEEINRIEKEKEEKKLKERKEQELKEQLEREKRIKKQEKLEKATREIEREIEREKEEKEEKKEEKKV